MKSRFPSTVSANPSLSSSLINHSFTDSWNTTTSIFAEQFEKIKIWKIFNEDVMASLTIYILENRQGIPCRFFLCLLCILKIFFSHRTNLNTCMIIFQTYDTTPARTVDVGWKSFRDTDPSSNSSIFTGKNRFLCKEDGSAMVLFWSEYHTQWILSPASTVNSINVV